MEHKPKFISFANQKGGIGKSVLTIFAASWLHYVRGLNVAVIDCDYPQHSISKQRIRDQEAVRTVPAYQSLFIRQSERGITPYPVLISNPMDGIAAWKRYEAASGKNYDVVLFDYLLSVAWRW